MSEDRSRGEPQRQPVFPLRALRRIALVGGVCGFAAACVLLLDSTHATKAEFIDSEELAALKETLRENPQNEKLRAEIRRRDLALRRAYFRRVARSRTAAVLLLGSVLVSLFALKRRAVLTSTPYRPEPRPANWAEGRARRCRVAVGSFCLAAGALSVYAFIRSRWPLPPTALREARSEKATYPTEEELSRQWPRFRGPLGSGRVASAGAPQSWNGPKGKNILWKTKVPLPGNSSPVVWERYVFLTGATAKKREVYCFDALTGQLLWRGSMEGIPGSPAKAPEVMESTGYASPTPATDGRRAYAIFANGDCAAFAYDGTRVWARSFGVPKNPYGHAASLLCWRDLLIVPFDQGDPESRKARLYAVDGRTGRVVWEVRRPVGSSWSTPCTCTVNGTDLIVTAAAPWVIAYEARTGKEVWRAECIDGDVAPSPVFSDGLVFTVNTGSCLAAIRPDGRGNVTKTHIVWTAEDGLPDICSPAAAGSFVFLCETEGYLVCYHSRTGKLLWEHEFDMTFMASPTVVGDLLYLVNLKGRALICRPTEKGITVEKQAELGEKVSASPAFTEGRIYLRGETHLFCIAETGKKEGPSQAEDTRPQKQ